MAHIQKDTQIEKVQLNELSQCAHTNRHITSTLASIRLNKPFVLEKRSHESFVLQSQLQDILEKANYGNNTKIGGC